MHKEPVISFVVPIYQKPPEVVERCLDSLFDQSLKEIEVVAVFDGKNEELEKVVRRYPKVKIVVIEHGGAPRARNEGFKHTSAPYVSFFDCDCYAKPEMARVWIETFERNPEVSFVYSGYEIVNEGGAFDSELFDLHSLQCGNYIATMFPMKREVFPGFDESLKAAQDWDLWLTIAEAGGTGEFIRGYGFQTEPSFKGSISFEGWSKENRNETIRRVREKHGIQDREIGVFGTMHYMKALHVAKLLGGDIIKGSGPDIKNYRLILNLGYSPMIRFEGVDEACVKCHYWMTWDIDCLYAIAHGTAKETIRLANKEVNYHFCNEIVSKKRLAELGIEAEILPLPTEIDDVETSLPEDFHVLLDIDKAYAPLVKDLSKDIPYVRIDTLERSADISKYSLLVSFHEHPTVDEGMRRFLLNGRNIISNVQAPYCGYMNLEVSHPEFRRDLFTKIRLARELPFNGKAQEYYMKLVDPSKFKQRILELLPKAVLEVL